MGFIAWPCLFLICIIPIGNTQQQSNKSALRNMKSIGDFDDSDFGDFGTGSTDIGDFSSFDDEFVRNIVDHLYNLSLAETTIQNETLPSTSNDTLEEFLNLPDVILVVNRLRNVSLLIVEVDDQELGQIVKVLKRHADDLQTLNDSELTELVYELRNISAHLSLIDEPELTTLLKKLHNNRGIWTALTESLNRVDYVNGSFVFNNQTFNGTMGDTNGFNDLSLDLRKPHQAKP